MITLGIDTALSSVSFAIVRNSKTLAVFESDVGRNLAAQIAEITTTLLKTAGVSAGNIDRCGIVAGPGSFTGLRIGIAFAKGLFADANTKIAAVSSLECAAKSCANTGEIAVIFDARQEEVFFAKFSRKENGDLIRITDDERISFDSALEKISKNSVVVYSFSGNSNSPLAQILSNFECFEAEDISGRAEAAAEFAENSAELQSIDEIFPNYMQLSYAEKCKK